MSIANGVTDKKGSKGARNTLEPGGKGNVQGASAVRSVHQISIGVQPTPARLRDRAPKGGAASPVNERFYKGGQFWPARPAGPDVVALMNEPAPEPIRLAIYGFTYTVRPIAVAAECGTAGFEMHRIDTGNTYHVHRDNYGCVKCDCGDYLFRHDGTATTCKHGSALVAKGLIPAPSPIPRRSAGG